MVFFYDFPLIFVCTPLAVRITQQGCHGNHAFSHSPNEFMFQNVFSASGGQGNNLSTMENCHGGARYVKLDSVV